MIAYFTGLAEPVYEQGAHSAAMQQLFRIFSDMRLNTPYPIQIGTGDWITAVTRATGTFTGELTLPNDCAIPRRARHSTWASLARLPGLTDGDGRADMRRAGSAVGRGDQRGAV